MTLSYQYKFKSDASGTAVGAVLERQHGDVWHPVEYFSKRLNDSESRYSATEREILGCTGDGMDGNRALASIPSW